MLYEIQKIIEEFNKQGKDVQLFLTHKLGDIEVKLNISYLAYEDGWIIIHSELAMLRLKVEFIASMGNEIILSREESFVVKIIFPAPCQPEVAYVIDRTIKQLNKVIFPRLGW